MIKEIYKNIAYSLEYMQQKSKEVDEYINEILNRDRQNLDNNEYEKKRDILFGVANKAEEMGFTVGFKYGVELILESLENSNFMNISGKG